MAWFVLFLLSLHIGRKDISTKVNFSQVLFVLVSPYLLVCKCIYHSHKIHHLINIMAKFLVRFLLGFPLLLLPMSFPLVLLFHKVFVTSLSLVPYSLYS